MNPSEVLQFIGIPVLIATGVIMLSWWILPSKRLQPLGAVLAVGISCFIAFVLQEGVPSVPPIQKWHWLALTVLLVSLLACLYPLYRGWDECIVLQAIIAGVIAAVLMQFPSQTALYERCIVFLMVLIVCVGLRRLTIPPWHMYVASWLILACISFLAIQSSFAKLAFFTGAMSAVAAAILTLQLIKPRETKSVQMIFGTLIVGCSLCGFAYDQNETIFKLAWFFPMVSIPLSAMVYLLLKHHKYRAIFSLVIIDSIITIAVILSILSTHAQEGM